MTDETHPSAEQAETPEEQLNPRRRARPPYPRQRRKGNGPETSGMPEAAMPIEAEENAAADASPEPASGNPPEIPADILFPLPSPDAQTLEGLDAGPELAEESQDESSGAEELLRETAEQPLGSGDDSAPPATLIGQGQSASILLQYAQDDNATVGQALENPLVYQRPLPAPEQPTLAAAAGQKEAPPSVAPHEAAGAPQQNPAQPPTQVSPAEEGQRTLVSQPVKSNPAPTSAEPREQETPRRAEPRREGARNEEQRHEEARRGAPQEAAPNQHKANEAESQKKEPTTSGKKEPASGKKEPAQSPAPQPNLSRREQVIAESQLLRAKQAAEAQNSPEGPASGGDANSSAPTPPRRRPAGSETPTVPPPPGGTQGILPNRVGEVDVNATRVTPAAYQGNTLNRAPISSQTTRASAAGTANPSGAGGSSTTRVSYSAQTRPVVPPYTPPPPPPAEPPSSNARTAAGCALRAVIFSMFVVILVGVGIGCWLIFQYFSIAASLPSVENLSSRASQFETTRIFDRNGNLLYEIYDPNAGRRTYVPLAKISPYLIAATIATEDKEYYSHPGFDPIAILRALWANYTTGGSGGGASTITQQLARVLLLSPEERSERTVQRKAREIVLAAEITRKYSKEQILELYLNENNYGNFSYGVEAAAEAYFNTTAERLTLSQATFLAGIPQAPAVYDVFTNRDATLLRHKDVLNLIFIDSTEKNCIYVSNSMERVCVTRDDAIRAAQEIEGFKFAIAQNKMRYPHWVTYIRTQLEARFDPQTIYRSGFKVYTTLDPGLQDQAQQIISSQVKTLADRHVTNGALVAIKPTTGEILAMVGSADFYNASISGQVNMAISPRQPGSSIKPLTYLAAFERGWTPSTLLWDVPSEFPPSGDPKDTRAPYVPVNYDGKFHGPVTVRSALANSYNIPAVKALQAVGIYDNANIQGEDGLIAFAKRVGITGLTRNDYGLALTLGGGEVTLLDMTSVYATLANSGRRMPPVSITKITDHNDKVIYEYKAPAGDQVIRAEHAYLMSSILSDNDARTPAFGANSVLALPFQAAVKTGTTNDYRDNWTMGYTPDVAVGVWVGNADYTPMRDVSGLAGAAPAWNKFIQTAVKALIGNQTHPFARPAGVVERVICATSGTEPSEWCPSQRTEVFAADQLPPTRENDLWHKVSIDTWTGLRASPECSDFVAEKFALNVTDATAIKWIRENKDGQAWAKNAGFESPVFFTPERDCKLTDPRPSVSFAGLTQDQTINISPLDIYAVVDATQNFKQFELDYGPGKDPAEWKALAGPVTNPLKKPDKVHMWDLKDIPAGTITLRLYLTSQVDTYAERRIQINIQVPTPTPTPTRTQTPTPTVTTTPRPTLTPTATLTPTVTSTRVPPTETLTPTSPPPPPEPTFTLTPTTAP